MELSVKEFNELVDLMLEARAEVARCAAVSAGINAKGSTGVPAAPAQPGTGVVPTPEVSSARFVVDTTEIQRVVAEAVDVEREAIAVMLAHYAAAFPEAQRGAVVGALEMVRQRVGRR